jgi:zinc-ribbon domain
MYCPHCGFQVLPDHRFCSKCGTALSGAAIAPSAVPSGVPSPGAITSPDQPSRIARHLNVLALLWIIFSLLRLVPGLAMLVFARTHFPFVLMPIPAPARAFLTPVLGTIGLLISGFAIAGVIAGWGLMSHQSWARVLAIVLGCISLIHFPLGTALGIYTLWVLAPQGAEREYCSLAGRA